MTDTCQKFNPYRSPFMLNSNKTKGGEVYVSLEPSLCQCFDSKDPTIMQMSDVTTALPPLSFNLDMKAYAQHQPHRISILHDLVYLYIKSRRGWLHVSIR